MKDIKDKPDFLKLGDVYLKTSKDKYLGVTSFDYAAGAEKIWTDYYLPAFKENRRTGKAG